MPTLRQRLHLTITNRPFTLPLAVAAVIVGCLTLYHGADVSEALSRLLPPSVIPGDTVMRFWGGLQIIGGVLVLWGVLRPRMDAERSGWSFLIGAFLFYAVGVLGGLGLQGAVAGTYAAALAAGSAFRAWGLKRIQETTSHARLARDD